MNIQSTGNFLIILIPFSFYFLLLEMEGTVCNTQVFLAITFNLFLAVAWNNFEENYCT